MTEAKVSFLYKIASTLCNSGNNNTKTLLRSHYLMSCKKIARGFNLPQKHFSSLARCPHCCLEWRKGTDVTLTPIQLSKRQRYRIKRLKPNNQHRFRHQKKTLLHGNKMEQICSFCGYSKITHLAKPENLVFKLMSDENQEKLLYENIKSNKKLPKANAKNKVVKNSQNHSKSIMNLEMNVYSNAYDVFALNNKANTLPNTVKDPPKIIKNNKRKKDKFAGLCKKAVLASAKLKEQQLKQDKLNLFLKPST